MHHPPNKTASVQIQDGWMAGTFSSRVLWCSNSNFGALSTSTSLVMLASLLLLAPAACPPSSGGTAHTRKPGTPGAPAAAAPAACPPSSGGTAHTRKPGTPGAPAAAAGQGQRSTINLMLDSGPITPLRLTL